MCISCTVEGEAVRTRAQGTDDGMGFQGSLFSRPENDPIMTLIAYLMAVLVPTMATKVIDKLFSGKGT